MTILFVTRKFPPSVGGMETLAADVWAGLRAEDGDARLVAHGRSNRSLPLFLPVAVARIVVEVVRHRVATVLVGDVLAYVVLAPVLRMLRVRHATMAMGKDVLWPAPLYRTAVRRTLHRAPRVIAISAATARAARDAGARAEAVSTVRLGVAAPDVTAANRSDARRALGQRFDVPAGATVLLTLGRLVRRKGVGWFVENVLPDLPRTTVLLVAGAGDEAAAIRAAAHRRGLHDRVRLLGPVSDADRDLLMCGADVFVQPNVRVAGDMEGFGLVAVEAAVRGALVVASDLEGLSDAVQHDGTGLLVPPEDASAWRTAMQDVLSDPAGLERTAARFQQRARALYSVEAMGREIIRLVTAAPTD